MFKRSLFPLAFFAVFASVAVYSSAQNLKEISPTPVAGSLVAMSAQLPTPKQGGGILPNQETLDENKLEKVNYYVFQPSDESAKTEEGFPLLFFLHGIGERGDNVTVLKNFGPVKICANPERAAKWKFFTVAPQCPATHFWSPAQLRVLLDKICDEFPIDRSRIYVTGLSMGGYGTWGMLASYPEIIAAAAPICGGGDPSKAEVMVKTPIWAFHGELDPLVPCDFSRNMIAELRKHGAEDAHITTYPGVGHDSWTRAYEEPELYEWLLSKKLGASEPSVPKAANASIFPPEEPDEECVPGKLARQSIELPKYVQRRDRSGFLDESSTQKLKYWAFIPTDERAKENDRFPLMLFLHGSGERGTNLDDLKRYGPPMYLNDPEQAKTWRFLTIAPQCPQGVGWSPAQLKIFIDKICDKFPVDKDRIYVTGVSMGGRGAWEMLTNYPEIFAAGVPICGWGNVNAAENMKNVPVWAFHGEEDTAVRCSASIEMIDALKKAGAVDARLTTYPGVGHNSWIQAYADQDMYEWLLSKKRAQ